MAQNSVEETVHLQRLGFCPKLSTPKQGSKYSFLCWCASGDPDSRGLRVQSNCLEPFGNRMSSWLHGPVWGRHCSTNFHHTKGRALPCLQSPEQGDDKGTIPNQISRGTLHCQVKLRVRSNSFGRHLEKRGTKK